MVYIIKIGGSILFDKNGDIAIERIKKLTEIIKFSHDIRGIVCGGGIIARKYISAGRSVGVDESKLDKLGIEISRINAKLFSSILGDKTYPIIIKSVEEAQKASSSSKIIVAGGFIPGQSTTTVAMQIAEVLNLNKLLILTDVDGIYDKNPKIFPKAKKYDEISIDTLEKIIQNQGDNQSNAGEYRIFDKVSLQIFKRNNIKIRLMNGYNPENLKKILEGDFESTSIGTMILKS